jgi:hypothetical protein
MLIPRVLVPLVAALALAACASDDAPPPFAKDEFDIPRPVLTFTDPAVNASKHFADTAIVEPGKVTVPRDAQNAELLARIVVGTVLAGNRDTSTEDLSLSKNPSGFLVKVTAIAQDGANTVLSTTQAKLNEWIRDGDLDFESSQSVFETDSGGVQMKAEAKKPTLADKAGGVQVGSLKLGIQSKTQRSVNPSGSIMISKFSLSDPAFKLNFKHDGYFKVRNCNPLGSWGPEFECGWKYRTHASVNPEAAVNVDFDIQVQGGLAKELQKDELKFNGLPKIPFIVPAPVPMTLELGMTVSCGVSATGSISGSARVGLKGHADFGLEGKTLALLPTSTKVVHDKSSSLDFVGTPTKEGIVADATLEAKCSLKVSLSLKVFGVAGIEGAVGPYASVNVQGCAAKNTAGTVTASQLAVYLAHGLEGDVSANLSILDKVIASAELFSASEELGRAYLVGNKDQLSCEVDGCDGKPDGYLCIAKSGAAAAKSIMLTCKGGKEVSRETCPNCSATSDKIYSCK